jgi:cell division protein FtsN
MAEPENWKDRIEISLDGRQIFFLFFGSAVAACLLFVAGVLVGKRIEQRAIASAPAVTEDPLAALDQIDQNEQSDDGLTFREALVREQKKREESHAAAPEPSPRPQPEAQQPAAAKPPHAPIPLPALPHLPGAPAPAAEKRPGHFALQVFSANDREKADSFATKIRAAGFAPQVVAAEVPGKGTVYRVRVGDYGSRQAADTARNDFNKKQPLGFAFVVSQ